MARRTDFKKALTYTGQKLNGPIELSYKIDGVRILCRDGQLVTRNNKVPVGLIKACSVTAIRKLIHYGDCELYTGSFHDVQGPISQLEPEPNQFLACNVYPLVDLDERLYIGTFDYVPREVIDDYLACAVKLGYEGLVIRANGHWYRHKPHHTADVRITGYFEQKDKHGNLKGQLGGFTTAYGNVTAFTDEMRQLLWDNPEQYIDSLMEVEYKELYATGKFRYAVKFLNFRNDKEEESFDT